MKVRIVNVFSINNQSGNPCAIVDNATHLNTDEMQAMATHFNLPETVFIIPDKNQYLLRFFATKGELPLCCHGTLGAAYYLFKSDDSKPLHIKAYQTQTNLDIACVDNLIAMSIVNNGKITDDNIDLDIISKLLAIDKTSINPYLSSAIASIGSPSSQPYSRSNQLAHYFFPDQQNDSRTEAWIYACTDCQVNAVPVFSHLFSPNDRPLALGNTPESQTAIKNNLSIQAILKDPKKITITTDSKALNGVAPKTVQETETVFQQLQNYYVLALVRVNPEYRNKLPLLKQLECLFKNFFKSTQEIGQERLESVQIYIGDFCAALSEEHVDAINNGFC